MKNPALIAGIVVLVIILLIGGISIGSYNSMVTKSEEADTKLADIDTQLQRRADLIPNLVKSVKGIMKHEQEAIDKVTEAREHLTSATSVSDKASADSELTGALNNFIAVAEGYPELKANENYTNLMDELAGTENRIATARRDYNEAVKSYNTAIKRMPGALFAGMFGFDAKEYFEAEEGANEVPDVDL